MPKRLLRFGVPIRLSKLRKLLEAVDAHDEDQATVMIRNGDLVIEEADPTLDVDDANATG